jgi:dTDP-4-amino-4,6-dideoxygalactose transaminase
VISKVRSFFRFFYSVPWCVPAWGWNEFVATARAFLTGTIVQGPSAERFGTRVREYLGMRFALPVNRGRTAIELGLRAMGVGPGDDILMPSFVCHSVIDAVLSTGATPVFADIDETLNVTASSVEAALTPKTKCVIVAHLFGRPAAIDEIEKLLTAKGIALMDDAAQALGARRGGRLLGSFGACGILSCGPGKPLAGAAGGLLLTNDRRLYERAAAIQQDLERPGDVAGRAIQFWLVRRFRRYTLPFTILTERVRGRGTERAHVNARLSNMDATIAIAQFDALDLNAMARRQNARTLLDVLSMLPGRLVTDFSPDGIVVKFVHLISLSGPTVQEAIGILARHGIEAQGGYSPLHTGRADDARLPNTVALWRRVLCVPVEIPSEMSRPIPFVQRAEAAGIEVIANLSPLSAAQRPRG